MRSLPLIALILGFAATGVAQDEIECPSTEIGPLDVTPAGMARDVTLDAYVKVRYSDAYFEGVDDPSSFLRVHRDLNELEGFPEPGEEVPGQVQLVGDDLFFLPDELFEPGADYVVVAESFEFEPLLLDFRTGFRIDSRPPVIGSVDEPTTERVGPSCGRGAGYRVDLVVRGVVDDGSPSSIELLVYLARQSGLESPELVLRSRGTGAPEVPLGFVLTDERANEPACVVVHAVDGVGKVDDRMEPVCFEPVQGAFFNGLCAANRVGGPANPGAGSAASLTLVALWLVARRRRRLC